MISFASLVAAVAADVPVDPDAPDAKKWLLDELGKPEYAAARPTLIDRIAKAIQDWLGSFTGGSGGGVPNIFPLVVTLLIVGLIVAAFFVFGRPRMRRRSALAAAVFSGGDDQRSSLDLRTSAQNAAAANDFVTAIEEMFRAIARNSSERTIVSTAPGMTAQDFASRASRAFPGLGDRLRDAAGTFDGVRYLDAEGSRQAYDRMAALEHELRTSSPARLDRVGTTGATR
ncbi:DUF4129 domain-containing protein [Agreia sp. COWG]|uniref:DUF4129 domain-containing protein n=1 Tax=Agreia sp. COWG TaxID=2773266 RepID=UPI00192539F5|nr:DUF4129 domain-containing protein [Agreia sp. COWG]CAD5993542.1 conserved protein of unknown function [Agreia sp. COWG]